MSRGLETHGNIVGKSLVQCVPRGKLSTEAIENYVLVIHFSEFFKGMRQAVAYRMHMGWMTTVQDGGFLSCSISFLPLHCRKFQNINIM
jgi:hypothetical protein